MKHVESIHFPTLFEYNCKYCGKSFGAKNNLYGHIFKYHRENKSGFDKAQEIFGVEKVDDQTKAKQEKKRKARNSLDENKRRFKCNECDYIASQSGCLKMHVMAKHQGIRFPCQVCDYKGTTKGNTNMHMKNKHSL